MKSKSCKSRIVIPAERVFEWMQESTNVSEVRTGLLLNSLVNASALDSCMRRNDKKSWNDSISYLYRFIILILFTFLAFASQAFAQLIIPNAGQWDKEIIAEINSGEATMLLTETGLID